MIQMAQQQHKEQAQGCRGGYPILLVLGKISAPQEQGREFRAEHCSAPLFLFLKIPRYQRGTLSLEIKTFIFL